MKPLLLRVHRWVALVFALPLIVVLSTGLVLSVEPSLVVAGIKPGSIDASRVEAMLAKHDPRGQARAIAYRSYDNVLNIGGRGGGTLVDMGTGDLAKATSATAELMGWSRRTHERLFGDMGWLLIASTVAMLVLAVVGVLMGLPRLANTVSGWHKGVAWILMPLVVLSPLSGLALVSGVTLAPPAPAEARSDAPMKLADAVRVVGARHDLSSLVWLRPQGGRMLARVVEGGEYRVYAVTPGGTVAMPRNWPRLWHEGNFAGHLSAGLNVVASLAMLLLLGTGLWIWGSRQLRRRANRVARARTDSAELTSRVS